MADVQSTHDIRAHAIDRKRAAEQKSKWNPKWANGVERVKLGPNDTKRPAHRWPKNYPAVRRIDNERSVRDNNAHRKLDHLNGEADRYWNPDGPDYNHSDEEYDGVLHSFDNPGPARSSQILTHAVTQAAQRFEDNQTSKLVKDEYEVVDSSDEHDHSGAGATDEDDFELV